MQKKELFKKIFDVENIFKEALEKEYGLTRIKGPLFVDPHTGFNDGLSGKEAPVSFNHNGVRYEIVQSLAKWKRFALKEYGFKKGEGVFVEMHAIRPNESDLSKYHSLHVDQYDWEKIISKEERNIEFLKQEVKKIYAVILKTKEQMMKQNSWLKHNMTKDIFFITSKELLDMYPKMSPEEREFEITKKHGAVFIIGIGHELSDGVKHGDRAPDYDDWNLNGDILVWDKVNQDVLELSSMGIRVDEKSILTQHKLANKEDYLVRPYHKGIINKELPLTIGGGIGRSRINMFILEQNDITNVK